MQLSVMTWLGGIVLGLGVALANNRVTPCCEMRQAATSGYSQPAVAGVTDLIFNLPQIFPRQPAGYCRIHSQPVCWR